MEKESIFLPPRSLASILQMAYLSAGENEPTETLTALLDPYYITYDQLQSIISTLYWPGALFANIKHPAYLIAKRLEKYRACDHLTKKDMLKKYFICAATMISHIWYTQFCESKGKYILHNNLYCASYQYSNAAVPFVWFAFDSHGVPRLVRYHPKTPPIEMEIMRSTKAGVLNTLVLKFFDSDDSDQTTGYSRICLQVFNETFMGIQSVEQNKALCNYMMIISEQLYLSRCLLVSPSTDFVWNMPVVLHKYE